MYITIRNVWNENDVTNYVRLYTKERSCTCNLYQTDHEVAAWTFDAVDDDTNIIKLYFRVKLRQHEHNDKKNLFLS